MTAYHGGKFYTGKHISKVIDNILTRKSNTYTGYCEPFCGMLQVYKHMVNILDRHNIKKRLAGDINESLIMMWRAAQTGDLTKCESMTKDAFKEAAHAPPSAIKGFVGHVLSVRGVYFSSYAHRSTQSLVDTRNRMCRIGKNLEDAAFSCGDYTQYSNLTNFVLYCDPPYRRQNIYYKDSTTDKSGTERAFFNADDTARFWKWCSEMAANNNLVIVSEYEPPNNDTGVVCDLIWTSSKYNENLWLVKGQAPTCDRR